MMNASALIVDFAFRYMDDLELSNFCDESDKQMKDFFHFNIFLYQQGRFVTPTLATIDFFDTICEFVDWNQVRSSVSDYVQSRKAAKHAERLSKALEIVAAENTLIPA